MDIWDVCSIIFIIIMFVAFGKILPKIIDGFLFTGRYELSRIPCFIAFISLVAVVYTNSNSKHSVMRKMLQLKDWFLGLENKWWLAVIAMIIIAIIFIVVGDSCLSLVTIIIGGILLLSSLMFLLHGVSIQSEESKVKTMLAGQGLDDTVIELYAGNISVLKIANLVDKTPREIYRILKDNEIYK